MQFRTLIQATRPSFLILSPVCVFLGASTAMSSSGSVDTATLVLVVIGALCAHISVNTLNEYADFKSGLDLITIKTPFSGGSGTLVEQPQLTSATLGAALASLTVLTIIGGYFVYLRGPGMLLIGLTGTLLITLYSTHIVRHPLVCLLAAGTGFGLIFVGGTAMALTGELTGAGLWAAVSVFFLINNLLLINQFPDIDADRSVGRRTLPMVIGTRRAAAVYLAFAAGAAAAIVTGVATRKLPDTALWSLPCLLPAPFVALGAWRYGRQSRQLMPYMAANVAISVGTPMVLAVTIFAAG